MKFKVIFAAFLMAGMVWSCKQEAFEVESFKEELVEISNDNFEYLIEQFDAQLDDDSIITIEKQTVSEIH